jgi:oligoribonuclease (3'-5' exoribonuclease)
MAAVGGPVCGQSPQTDLRWLETAGMPLLRKCFNHRVFDVSTLKLGNMIECAIDDSGEDSSTAAHRALDDIRYSIRCARMYLGLE